MIKIPTNFKMLNNTYTVEVDNELFDKKDCYGLAVFRDLKIFLANKEKHNINDSIIERTFVHELLHMAFNEIQEPELRDNEKLVDLLANVLVQAFNTMEFKND